MARKITEVYDIGRVVGIEGNDPRSVVAVLDFLMTSLPIPVSVSRLQESGVEPYIGCGVVAYVEADENGRWGVGKMEPVPEVT